MGRNWKDTIFLPKTDFPMKANLPQLEPKIIKFWQENRIYEKVLEMRQREKENGRVFVLHDGPPYANGRIHLGHALNKIIKDITVKYKLMRGWWAPFVPGWDCHGLPIELQVEKKIGRGKPPKVVREESREYARKYIELQRQDFIRLGVFGLWQNPYITMSPDYEANIIRKVNELFKKGYIYTDRKPVFWCPNCVTALAEAEVEYKNKRSPSIFVAFPSKDKMGFDNLYALVWTTTPWTIPANVALAFKPDIKYVIVKWKDKNLIVASSLAQKIFGNYEKEGEFFGADFEGRTFEHPIFGRDSKGVVADFVSEEEGTGIVHIAPGHGMDDWMVGREYKLPTIVAIDDRGRGTRESGYEGLWYEDISRRVIEDLRKKGLLVEEGEIEHSYPHCWRCKKPVVFRATRQWFIDLSGLKDKAIEQIQKVKWIPPETKERITTMVKVRFDWCISRQRNWGAPIPYVVCRSCGEYIWLSEIAQKLADEVEKGGVDVWWEKDVSFFLPEGTRCPSCGGVEFEKGKDILDVWIDSGLSFSYITKKHDFPLPLDLYVEGPDQHRGWFQSSLLLAVALEGKAPYKSVFTHGFILDEFKRKMSKSIGNVISPEDIIKQYGAEIIRMWVVMSEHTQNVKISENILESVKDAYRKIRNTIRFMLGVLADFDGKLDSIPQDLSITERYILTRLSELSGKVIDFYEKMEYHRVAREIYLFCEKELSNFFLDISKDTLYCDHPDDPARRRRQKVILLILWNIILLLAPELSFLAEEAYSHVRKFLPSARESVFMHTIEPFEFSDKRAKEIVEVAFALRERLNEEADRMRKSGQVGSSLELKVDVRFPKGRFNMSDEEIQKLLEEVFVVSKVKVVGDGEAEVLQVSRFDAPKCPRCWKLSDKIGQVHPELCPRCAEVVEKMGIK